MNIKETAEMPNPAAERTLLLSFKLSSARVLGGSSDGTEADFHHLYTSRYILT